MPYFSITIPVYNVEKYICQCIDSVLHQSFQDYEVIIVDDGTKDKSGNICDEYAAKDKRFKVIHKQNEGLLMARRTALEFATGQFVLFLDSDDYWENSLLKSVYDAIQRYKCDIVMYRYKCVDERNRYLYSQKKLLPNETVVKNANYFLLDKLSTDFEYNPLWLKAVKREIIDIDADYTVYADVNMGEDVLQSISIALRCQRLLYLEGEYYCYRMNTKGMTRNISIRHLVDFISVRKEILKGIDKLKGEKDLLYQKSYTYILRGFFTCLADIANGKNSKAVWTQSYELMSKSDLFIRVTAKKTTTDISWKSYMFLLNVKNYYIYIFFGKIKRMIQFLYERIN